VRASPPSWRSGRRASAAVEEAQDLSVLRPAALSLLREDDAAVRDDVELRLLALADRRGEPLVVELGRETRGPFVVPASDGAVEDLDDGHPERIGTRRDAAPVRYSGP
jgi:hypothetical protein